MKLKIEVDLSQFYAENFEYDEDLGGSGTESISSEVVDIIKCEVKAAIAKQIRDEVAVIAREEFARFGNERIQTVVDHEIDGFVEKGMIKDQYHNTEKPVKEWLHQLFSNGHQVSSVDAAMKRLGEQFSRDCKERYDMHFATNIVRGLENQGLLKAGVFEAITSDKG